jgi:hypothetical protein
MAEGLAATMSFCPTMRPCAMRPCPHAPFPPFPHHLCTLYLCTPPLAHQPVSSHDPASPTRHTRGGSIAFNTLALLDGHFSAFLVAMVAPPFELFEVDPWCLTSMAPQCFKPYLNFNVRGVECIPKIAFDPRRTLTFWIVTWLHSADNG